MRWARAPIRSPKERWPSGFFGWAWAALCGLLLSSFLWGCSGSEGQQIQRFTLQTAERSERVDLPVHLDRALPERVGTYRLSTTVTLAEDLRGRDIDLAIPHLAARVSLRADGELVQPAFSMQAENAARHVGPHRWAIPRAAIHDGRLSLELEVAHTWTQSAWLDVVPRLVPSRRVTPVMERNRILNDRGGWFGLIGLSQMGLTFLAIFFWDRRRRAYLWFAIQALTASYYPAYVLGLTTGLGAKLETLLLAQCLSIAPIISVYYTHASFERGKPHRLWLVLLAIGVLIPVPAMFPDFIDASYGTPGVILCVGATIVYQIAVGTRLVRTYADRGIGLFFLCCWLALGGSAWVDLWAWIGGGEILSGARPACIGLGLFGIFQSMLLSRSHFRSMEEADRLNVTLRGRLRDLEERQAEIEALNEELRQQVGRRSAHILAALAQSGSRTSVRLEPGDLVEDRYRVLRALGSGGMGSVYEVERLHDGRRLALKVALETRGLSLARLAREAQIATRVRHPNVVAVVDTDVATAGYVYLVMELVEGCSLAQCEGRRDVAWCLKVLVQILEGIRALHTQGIVHRDLKPANVLLSGDIDHDPHVKVTDFGISRGPAEAEEAAGPTRVTSIRPESATVRTCPPPAPPGTNDSSNPPERARALHSSSSSTPQLTRTGAISGTPSYIAPELARSGSEITPALDVFSFGVVAYRLLTGLPPHAESPFLAELDGRTPVPHVPLSVPGLDARVAHLLDACLAFLPEDRPETDELMSALRDALERPNPTENSATAQFRAD